ncbi:40535_t:CDS:2 [Gigaspora margarita]|uniref:40535_t:CDS:1 n=1 Tax=Gigaspora margarita TaxID=4874 RepID=A0ABN7VBC7_GIGMA|nr:40535_t:CDS:2 [Gigaspora margarita]
MLDEHQNTQRNKNELNLQIKNRVTLEFQDFFVSEIFSVDKVPGYVCDPNTTEKCEASDLSGKHGPLQGTSSGNFMAKYHDEFISLRGTTTLDNGVIDRPIVIHSRHTAPGVPAARIACADINTGKCREKESADVKFENV